jgi:hypothetical protein
VKPTLHTRFLTGPGVLDQHIDNVFTDNDSIVNHRETVLLPEREARLAQFMRKRVLINTLNEP